MTILAPIDSQDEEPCEGALWWMGKFPSEPEVAVPEPEVAVPVPKVAVPVLVPSSFALLLAYFILFNFIV